MKMLLQFSQNAGQAQLEKAAGEDWLPLVPGTESWVPRHLPCPLLDVQDLHRPPVSGLCSGLVPLPSSLPPPCHLLLQLGADPHVRLLPRTQPSPTFPTSLAGSSRI